MRPRAVSAKRALIEDIDDNLDRAISELDNP
jgi:hypothetical protein